MKVACNRDSFTHQKRSVKDSQVLPCILNNTKLQIRLIKYNKLDTGRQWTPYLTWPRVRVPRFSGRTTSKISFFERNRSQVIRKLRLGIL